MSPHTPLAAPFISFTDSDTYRDTETKFAVWPKVWPSKGLVWPTTTAAGAGELTKTIIRAVRVGESARFSPYNDDNLRGKGIVHHGLTKRVGETVAAFEKRFVAKIAELNSGPLTVNNSSAGFGVNNGGNGPEGWFDRVVNGLDLQLYNCVGSLGDTLDEKCWVSTNGD